MPARRTRAARVKGSRHVTGPALTAALAIGRGATPREAAVLAGASVTDVKSWMKNADVQRTIEMQRVDTLAERSVDQEWIRRHLRSIVYRYKDGHASETGALRALELLGKDLGMWQDTLKIQAIVERADEATVRQKLAEAIQTGALVVPGLPLPQLSDLFPVPKPPSATTGEPR
jgi:hypothetical protein